MTARYNRIRTRPQWRGGPRRSRRRSPEVIARFVEKLRRMGLVPVWVDGLAEPIGFMPWYRLN
jgi:hypothetical protein